MTIISTYNASTGEATASIHGGAREWERLATRAVASLKGFVPAGMKCVIRMGDRIRIFYR